MLLHCFYDSMHQRGRGKLMMTQGLLLFLLMLGMPVLECLLENLL
jgi:hypothetical protein